MSKEAATGPAVLTDATHVQAYVLLSGAFQVMQAQYISGDDTTISICVTHEAA